MNGLDAGGLETFRNLVQMLQREYGTTVLVSSHQFEELDLIATHIGIMSGTGDLLFQGTRQELAERAPQALVQAVDRAVRLGDAHHRAARAADDPTCRMPNP